MQRILGDLLPSLAKVDAKLKEYDISFVVFAKEHTMEALFVLRATPAPRDFQEALRVTEQWLVELTADPDSPNDVVTEVFLTIKAIRELELLAKPLSH